ncbi:hypothetical protein OK074_6957 [Actinobacteria bacterium OK074]|nr:hypothetical protein OK074_6957 [Actinobacteria bacterium OK074]
MRTPHETPGPPESLSAHCTVAKRPGYEGLHAECRQTQDIPLPHSGGHALLVHRCTCACHAAVAGAA